MTTAPVKTYCDLRHPHKNNECLLYPLTSVNGQAHLTAEEWAEYQELWEGLEQLEERVRKRRGLEPRKQVVTP